MNVIISTLGSILLLGEKKTRLELLYVLGGLLITLTLWAVQRGAAVCVRRTRPRSYWRRSYWYALAVHAAHSYRMFSRFRVIRTHHVRIMRTVFSPI